MPMPAALSSVNHQIVKGTMIYVDILFGTHILSEGLSMRGHTKASCNYGLRKTRVEMTDGQINYTIHDCRQLTCDQTVVSGKCPMNPM